jgi:tRNA wybutosine-synthesizing protein 2
VTARPLAPVERVRVRVASTAGAPSAALLPEGYQRLGRVLVVKLPEELRARFPEIGEAYRRELGVETVLCRSGPIAGDWRVPATETIAGGPTETEVREHGLRYRFDAAQLMFAAGNRSERLRAGRLVRPGEVVADLFAGIGYFTLPAAVLGRARRVVACEANPLSHRYLVENIERNGVADRVSTFAGDNRKAPLLAGQFDRVFLGLLPSAVPWVDRALPLLRADGGWLHVHGIEGVRPGGEEVAAELRRRLELLGGAVDSLTPREVKAYGPGRRHVVVDARVVPPTSPSRAG